MDVNLDVDEEELVELIEATTVEVEGKEESLPDLVKDIETAHDALDKYKSGSIYLTECIEERIGEAKRNGEDDLIPILKDMKDTSFGVHLRLSRGDDELLGDRDGEYSDYIKDI